MARVVRAFPVLPGKQAALRTFLAELLLTCWLAGAASRGGPPAAE